VLCLTVRPRSSRAHRPRPAPVNDANPWTVETQSVPLTVAPVSTRSSMRRMRTPSLSLAIGGDGLQHLEAALDLVADADRLDHPHVELARHDRGRREAAAGDRHQGIERLRGGEPPGERPGVAAEQVRRRLRWSERQVAVAARAGAPRPPGRRAGAHRLPFPRLRRIVAGAPSKRKAARRRSRVPATSANASFAAYLVASSGPPFR
jgi:hypothetical protein